MGEARGLTINGPLSRTATFPTPWNGRELRATYSEEAMAQVNAQKILDKRKKTQVAVDPNVVKGEVPAKVIDELVTAKASAKNYASAFGEAIKAQAAKYGVKPAALRKFVTAREADKVDELEAETGDLEKLLG